MGSITLTINIQEWFLVFCSVALALSSLLSVISSYLNFKLFKIKSRIK